MAFKSILSPEKNSRVSSFKLKKHAGTVLLGPARCRIVAWSPAFVTSSSCSVLVRRRQTPSEAAVENRYVLFTAHQGFRSAAAPLTRRRAGNAQQLSD
jgi:hypothetical protein